MSSSQKDAVAKRVKHSIVAAEKGHETADLDVRVKVALTSTCVEHIENVPDDNSNSSSSSGSDESDNDGISESECDDGEQLEEGIITENDFYFSYDIIVLPVQ